MQYKGFIIFKKETPKDITTKFFYHFDVDINDLMIGQPDERFAGNFLAQGKFSDEDEKKNAINFLETNKKYIEVSHFKIEEKNYNYNNTNTIKG